MAKIDPFEKFPHEYDEWFEKNKFAYLSELEAIEKFMPMEETGVEIGVGSGRFAAALGIKVGVEPSPKMRKIAAGRGIEVFDGVAENLPFDDSSFNFALMVTVICFLDSIEKAFKETFRILKPGGSIIIGFIDGESSLGKYYQECKKDSSFYKIANFFKTEEVMENLKKAGFDDFSIVQTIFKKPSQIHKIEQPEDGYGKGSFVVVKAIRKN